MRNCPYCKDLIENCGGQTFVKKYKCPFDGTIWEDVWCCACNDKCPKCNKEIEPYEVL